MLLFELAEPDPLLIQIAAITSQLKSDLEKNPPENPWSTEDLLNLYNDHGIVLDKSDLYNMIKRPPLNKVITNIEGDTIVFKGQNTDAPTDQEQSQKVVSQMAQDAAQNLQTNQV